MANTIGGAQGNTGTVIIGKNPLIDNPLDPWWDIQGAVNSTASQVNTDKHLVKSVSSTVSGVANTVNSGISDIADIGKVLGNLQLWKGLGLVIAGVIILIIIGVAAVK